MNMNRMNAAPPRIEKIARIDFRLEPKPWHFESERAVEIDAHWAKLIANNPLFYNGRVLLMPHAKLEETAQGLELAGSCLIAEYKSFLAWRAFGFPETGIRNGFAMAALRSADGAFLLGEMGPLTASPGRIYFPAGTPDPNDLTGDVLDLEGSVLRELAEETGLTAQDVALAPNWTVVFDGPYIACMKTMQSALSARELVDRVGAFLAREQHPELVRLKPVFDASDFDEEHMPKFIISYLTHALAQPASS